MSEDVLLLIEELKKRIKALEDSMGERNRQRAFDRGNIAELKQYINPKGRTRNDYDILANELMKEVLNRTRGLDYKMVMNLFNFGSREEAYRLMDKTVKKFPLDVGIKHILNSKRKKRLIARVGVPI